LDQGLRKLKRLSMNQFKIFRAIQALRFQQGVIHAKVGQGEAVLDVLPRVVNSVPFRPECPERLVPVKKTKQNRTSFTSLKISA
jgi:hypothetical protein